MVTTTLEKTRKALSKMMKDYENGGEAQDHQKFRNMVYGFSVLLQFWKTEKDIEIEKRLDELEAKIEEEGLKG